MKLFQIGKEEFHITNKDREEGGNIFDNRCKECTEYYMFYHRCTPSKRARAIRRGWIKK